MGLAAHGRCSLATLLSAHVHVYVGLRGDLLTSMFECVCVPCCACVRDLLSTEHACVPCLAQAIRARWELQLIARLPVLILATPTLDAFIERLRALLCEAIPSADCEIFMIVNGHGDASAEAEGRVVRMWTIADREVAAAGADDRSAEVMAAIVAAEQRKEPDGHGARRSTAVGSFARRIGPIQSFKDHRTEDLTDPETAIHFHTARRLQCVPAPAPSPCWAQRPSTRARPELAFSG